MRKKKLTLEKRTGESKSAPGLKPVGGIDKKEEGETGGGDKGSEDGESDLNFGISRPI